MRYLLLAVLLAVGLAGCLGSGTAPSPGSAGASRAPTSRLQIAVQLLPRTCPFGALSKHCPNATPTRHLYTLTCGPAGGTAPNPRAACRAIGDYLKRRGRLGGCVGVLTPPGPTTVIAGTFAHRPFLLRLTAGYSWCGRPRALLRDFWVLSTFPCSTFVVRTGGRYPAWPRATGCTIDSA